MSSSVQIFELQEYADGTYNFGPVDVPDDADAADFRIQSYTAETPLIWPDVATGVEVAMECSIDGAPWGGMGGMAMNGGPHTGKGGVVLAWVKGGGGLPSGVNRRVRGTKSVTGGPLYSQATLEIS